MFQEREAFRRQGHVRARLHNPRRQFEIRQRESRRRRQVRVPRWKSPGQSERRFHPHRALWVN